MQRLSGSTAEKPRFRIEIPYKYSERFRDDQQHDGSKFLGVGYAVFAIPGKVFRRSLAVKNAVNTKQRGDTKSETKSISLRLFETDI
ncbi:MAG TPA: hypothetical protein PK364_12380, partial [Synergistaceae bacterium]|nr:hypothetical protein [Synergistaceae bacterium]